MHKFLIILLISGTSSVQSGWDLLSLTQIRKGYDTFMDQEIDLPDYPEIVQSMQGKKITLEGYIIPLQKSVAQNYFVLSRYPYQSCFFCGGAGPETVAEVYSDRGFKYTDERVRVTGTLKLNPDDPLRLFFILEDCTVVSL